MAYGLEDALLLVFGAPGGKQCGVAGASGKVFRIHHFNLIGSAAMTENSDAPGNKRNIWMRGLFMLLMALAFHVCVTVLFIVAVIQFVMALLNDTPNVRLVSFGRSMGNYLRQIVSFLTFATEEMPFPFSEWPAAE